MDKSLKYSKKAKPASMILVSEKTQDRLVLTLPILWLLMIVLVYMGSGFLGMYLGVIHACINAFLGLREDGKVNKKLFYTFVIGWGIFMSFSITGMIYYYNFFGNNIPDFTIWGMHPSGFFLYVVYWLGNLVYLAGLLYYFKDTWLPQEKWDDFVEYAETLKEKEGEENRDD